MCSSNGDFEKHTHTHNTLTQHTHMRLPQRRSLFDVWNIFHLILVGFPSMHAHNIRAYTLLQMSLCPTDDMTHSAPPKLQHYLVSFTKELHLFLQTKTMKIGQVRSSGLLCKRAPPLFGLYLEGSSSAQPKLLQQIRSLLQQSSTQMGLPFKTS